MDQFVPKVPKLHYIFRNRLSELYNIIDLHKLDGIILIAAYDCSYSKPMHQFIKWLLFGCSSLTIIDEFSIPPEFSETFMIITKQQLFIFSQSSTRDFFYEITSKICNTEIFITSKKEEENSETLEIQKISKFIEFTKKIKKIGIPLDYNQRQNIVLLDRWPLLTATALDCLGLGFFTMNHDIIDISKDLELYYHRIDIGSILTLINAKTEFLENTYTDFINHVQKEPINKRLNTTEDNLNLNQNLELIRINYQKQKNDLYSFLKDLPDPRILYGINTNKNKTETSSTEALFKITYDFKFPSFHLTYENIDPTTGIRICRTIFLYNMQKKYLDMNQDTFQYDFIETKAYKEIFYFFNLYYILVSFFRKIQNEIILLKTDIPKTKDNIKELINNFIKKYIKENNIDIKNDEDYLLKKENIYIDLKKYVLLDIDNTSTENENKIIVLRFELKNIISIYTHRPIGSLLYCDSFLLCYDELYNITSDILPFKFIQTSTQHYKDDINYNQQQILLSLTNIKIKDIDYKAIQFYKNDFNIPYLFTDGFDDNLSDHNQIFIFYSGKINLYEDYFTFSDDSVGNIIIGYNNIETFDYLEERNYTVILIKFKDMDNLPLSGIVKDEILFYFKGSTERWRSYSREMIDFMRGIKCLRGKIGILNEDKKYEYEIVMKTINENEIYNLSNISNSFNLTNVSDSVIDMIEYEYLKYNNKNFDKLKDYKKKLNEYLEEINPVKNEEEEKTGENEIKTNTKDIKENPEKNKKLMFLFGPNPLIVNNIRKKLVDFLRKNGYKYNEIIPELSLYLIKDTNDQNKIIQFYADKISQIKEDPKVINIIFIYNICNILSFIKELNQKIENFEEKYDILNISYAINYSWIKTDRFKNKIPQNFLYEDIINNIFIEEGLLSPNKIEKLNKYISMSNPKAKLYTTRSFYLNEKELRQNLFESYKIKPKLIKFYLNYYENLEQDKPVYQNVFIPFKYMIKKDLFQKFFNNSINSPLFFKWKTKEIIDNNKSIEKIRFPLDEPEKPKLSDDTEYQKYLGKIVSMAKVTQIEPIFIQIFGNTIFIQENNNEKRIISEFECNYKMRNIKDETIEKNNKNNIGIFILGKNLIFENNYDFYEKMLFELCGKFPELRQYKKKEDITEKERENLNYINLTRPLPPGWSLEGPVVVDDKDEIHYEHPYLEQFIDEYIELNNQAIDQYNNNVKKQIEDLLI